MKRKFIVIWLLLILLYPSSLSATSVSGKSLASHYDYEINQYTVDVNVNTDNSLDITETINAFFNQRKHGIIRNIPLKNKVERLDGSKETKTVSVENLEVNEQYTLSKKDGYLNIQLGSASKTIIGAKEYIIKYKYNLGKDKNKNFDELYFNIIGTKWDTIIENVSFKITMPKDFDTNKIGFSKGTYGSVSSDKIKYEVNDNTIQGTYKGILNPKEGLTIRIELPDNYFTRTKFNLKSFILGIALNLLTLISTTINAFKEFEAWIYVVPVGAFIITFIIWYFYKRNPNVVVSPEFYPPQNLNSLQVGYIFRGYINHKDISSMLVYLADQGYITITDISKKHWFSKKIKCKITKVKEYDGDNKITKKYWTYLFMSPLKETTPEGEKVEYLTEEELEMSIIRLTREFFENGNEEKNINLVLTKKSINANKAIKVLIILTAAFLIYVLNSSCLKGSYQTWMTLMSLFFGLFYVSFYFANVDWLYKIFNMAIIFVFSTFFGHGFSWLIAVSNSSGSRALILFYLVFIGLMSLLYQLPGRRTKKVSSLYGQILGFRNFLMVAKKDELDLEVEKNPEYFYDILPYTYVLGISYKWLNKFDCFHSNPDINDSSSFDLMAFNNLVASTASISTRTINSLNNYNSGSSDSSWSSSSGGSSGGGFSGGGSGGGGGSSW